jgi:DNA replication and repair protein RecF
MDTLISQYSRAYLERLILYNKALQQRNALLTSIRQGQEKQSSLEPWDMVLSEHGTFIHGERRKFFTEFLPIFYEAYTTLCGKKEDSRIEYVSDLSEQSMEDLLARSVSKDIILERTTCGIHKDDMLLSLSDQPFKKYGSQGQQKTLVISLKIAQFRFLQSKLNVKPLLMLDDIFDKIDDKRVKALMELITDGNFGQVFITDTSLTRVPEMLGSDSSAYKLYNTNLDPVVREKA